MKLPILVKVEWENGDVTIEKVVSMSLDCTRYVFDENVNGNYWAPSSMCTFINPTDLEAPEIRIGQIFVVEGKKYVIVQPMSDQQLADSNDHGHLVLTLIDI